MKEVSEENVKTGDFEYSIFTLFLGFFYLDVMFAFSRGIGAILYMVCFLIGTGIYFRKKEIKQTKESIIYIIILVLSSAYFAIYENMLIEIFIFVMLIFYLFIWSAAPKNLLGKGISKYIMGDLINQIVFIPLLNLGNVITNIRYGFEKTKKRKNIMHGVIGFLIMLPILIIIICLLTNADEMFEELMGNILDVIDIDAIFIVKIIFGIPLGCYIGGSVIGNANIEDIEESRKDYFTKKRLDKDFENLQVIPRVTVYTALFSLIFVYILYVISQMKYLVTALKGSMPKDFTYSSYAVRGFWEMCAVVVLNLLIIFAVHIFIKRSDKKTNMLRTLSIFVLGFTFIMIITDIIKMIMYINAYGLTESRLYATWFMITVFIGIVFVLIRMFKRMHLVRNVVFLFSISLLILGYINPKNIVVSYNVEQYKNGSLKEIDYDVLETSFDAGIEEVVNLYNESENDYEKYKLAKINIFTTY